MILDHKNRIVDFCALYMYVSREVGDGVVPLVPLAYYNWPGFHPVSHRTPSILGGFLPQKGANCTAVAQRVHAQ